MRWKNRRRSGNIEDQRGRKSHRAARMGAGGAILFRLLPMLMKSKGGRKVLIIGGIILVGAHFSGINLGGLLGSGTSQSVSGQSSQSNYQPKAGEQQLAEFIAVVLADTEDVWHGLFKPLGKSYVEPKLVMFSGNVKSACGFARSAMGPFYCTGDNKVYIDLSFYDDLKNRHGAPGDFAQAYVIAHEVGHHVQNILGISHQVHAAKKGASQVKANQLSVRQELQADCFAGLWAHHAERAHKLLELGDLEEALVAASAIGDDRLQHQSKGFVTPDSFTHGSSEQRMRWFKRGFTTGSLSNCDSFKAAAL